MKLITQIISKHTSRYYESLHKYAKLNAHIESTTEQAFKRLLDELAYNLGLTLIKVSESISTKARIIPDGIIVNEFNRRIGYWEAKDTQDDLKAEILKKIDKGYPLKNTIFEDTRTAILYQDGIKVLEIKMKDESRLTDLLLRFFNYNEPILEEFRRAVTEFKINIPLIALGLAKLISEQKVQNIEFKRAVDSFLDVCSASFHSDVSENDIEDMLIQHLLTERIFRKVFDNPEFVKRNVIASQLEKLVTILTKQSFNRGAFFKNIDFFYQAIEHEAAQMDDFSEKQGFLNTIYEIFFQSYSKKNADKNGIVYTPQSLVRFMVRFTDRLLKQEFGVSLSSKGVNIIDPCTGTGNFIMEILRNIDPQMLTHKFKKELFCNEIMLLPYYVASVNIEYFYFQTTGEYKSFENIVFTDTLELIEDKRQRPNQQGVMEFGMVMNEANTERAKRQLESPLFVIVGNPPYNAQQQNENDNNKNKRNIIIDKRISETYAKTSKAQLRNKLYDPYVKFFRWASDRLREDKGLVCFVTNNSFMDDIQFDGMRAELLKEFHRVYHFDLGGDVNANPKLSGSKHNIFGIKVGVGITFLVKNSEKYSDYKVMRMSVGETFLTRREREEVLDNLNEFTSKFNDLDWKEGYLDTSNNFSFDENAIEIAQQYETFIPLIGENEYLSKAIFAHKFPGISTNRNDWVYDFKEEVLIGKMQKTIDFYNEEVTRLEQFIVINNLKPNQVDIDDFVRIEEDKIKWSRDLKGRKLRSLKNAYFDPTRIYKIDFRPFTKKYFYYDYTFVDSPSKYDLLEKFQNKYLTISGLGSKKVSAFVVNSKPNLDLLEKTQCFPLVYVEEKKVTTNDKQGIEYRAKSNLTPFAYEVFFTEDSFPNEVERLEKIQKGEFSFQEGQEEAIFHYVYAILHHTVFRKKFESLLKTTAPRVPLVKEHFEEISVVGKKLATLHLNFETVKRFPLMPTDATQSRLDDENFRIDWSIERMRITKERHLRYNAELVYHLPAEAFGYEVNGRTPVEWIADQYKDMNTNDDSILAMIERCITVTNQSAILIARLNDLVKLD